MKLDSIEVRNFFCKEDRQGSGHPCLIVHGSLKPGEAPPPAAEFTSDLTTYIVTSEPKDGQILYRITKVDSLGPDKQFQTFDAAAVTFELTGLFDEPLDFWDRLEPVLNTAVRNSRNNENAVQLAGADFQKLREGLAAQR